MGAENSVLEGCDWGDQIPCPNAVQWKITPVTKKDGLEAVVFQPKHSDKKDNNLLQKSAKMLKGLRHPNVVRFLGCGSLSDGFWLATEPVSPLLATVNDLGITSYELMAGVWDILQALDFLHSKLGVCHNNLCPASIYVSKDGSWKLGGMEHACKFLEATPEFLEATRAFRNEDCLAPEEKTGNVKLDMATPHARDLFALGAMVDALMDFVRDRNDKSVEELEKKLTPCVSSDPSTRPTTSTLINSSIFRSDFIETIAFIKNVTVKTEEQKKKFFSTLLPKLRSFPEEVVARKLILPLLSRFVLLDETAEREVVPFLLKPDKDEDSKSNVNGDSIVGLLSEDLFRVHVIPHVCNIFRVHDCHIRLVLLTHFHHYVHLFSREQLEEDIFLQILLGVRDTDDRLVAASLRALAELVPLLGGDFVVGGSRKCFFFHGIPKPVSLEDIQNLSSSTRNVGSVLSSSRVSHQPSSPSAPKIDPNHKPLLKDLAYGLKASNHSASSITSTITSEEKERKMREREQRREEARLKREERRMKLKTKQVIVSGAAETTAADSVDESALIIKKVASVEQDGKNPTLFEDNVTSFNDIKKGERDPDDGLIRHEVDSECFIKEEVDHDTEDKPDWSDWEDADGNISDEIEEELKHMSQSDNFNDSSNNSSKVPTSPNPYQKGDTLDNYPNPSSPVDAVSWSEISSSTTRDLTSQSHSQHVSAVAKGPFTLGGRNGSQSDLNKTDSHQVGDTNSLSSSSLSVGSKALKLKNTNSSSSSSTTISSSSTSSTAQTSKLNSSSKSKPKNKPVDDLGLGYDIKSIEIKSKSVIETNDLFADMAPVISASSSSKSLVDSMKDLIGNSITVRGDDRSSSVKEPKDVPKDDNLHHATLTNSTLFAVDTTSQGDQEDADWGDDDGWGADDF